MIYFLIIGLPVLFAFLADKTKGSLSTILVLFAIGVPVLFAAVRDLTVGTDVMTYGIWTYRSAVFNGLSDFMASQSSIAAPGYNLIAWLSGHLGTFEIYLGTLQFLTVAPIYLYARRRCPSCSWAAMAVYMLLLFPISLNAMKQMMAVALCLSSYSYIEDRRAVMFTAHVLLVSIFIHQTAVVFLISYPVARLLMDSDNSKLAFFGRAQGLVTFAIIMGLFVAAFVGGSYVIGVASSLKDSYTYQLNAEGTRVNYSALVMSGFFLLALLIQRFWKSGENADSPNDEEILLCVVCLVAFLTVQLNMVADSVGRFAYYFMAFVPLYVSRLLSPSSKYSERVLGLACVLLLIAYFYVVCVVNGGDAVYPYTSSILGVL